MNAASTGAATAAATREAQGPARVDRLLVAVPVAFAFVALLTLYFVEAWLRKTPWVFTDELEWSEISRAIAATGHPARRGQPVGFKSLYVFLLAPFWWIHSTAAAYAAIKYMNAIVMTLAAWPTYMLARMLVPRRTAVVVAFLSVVIPGMTYAASIVPEVMAYPWYALCSWLIVRALSTWRPVPIALAGVMSILAVAVRAPQFGTVPASFLIAGAALWVLEPHGRRMRRYWSRGDTLGAIVLLVGALLLFNHLVMQHIMEWHVATEYWKSRMLNLGLQAGLAFTVGMGILPVIGGFSSLRLRERREEPAYRAFTAYLAASIVALALYTGVKAAILSTEFATLTEERNLIYLSPLMLIGTAMAFHARRLDRRVVAAATAFVLFLVFVKPPDLLYPYFEAPGYGILDVANRRFRWDVTDLRFALLVVVVLALAALTFRRSRRVAAAAVVLGAAWMLTAQISTTNGEVHFSQRFRAHLPTPLDWIDRDAHGEHVDYLGQEILDSNGIWETEFWNRSIFHVGSMDGSAVGPGPTYSPNIVSADGDLTDLGHTPYVVADNGVKLQAPIVALSPLNPDGTRNQLVLYRRKGPWKLRDSEQQVYNDGWMPNWASYTYFEAGQRGTLVLHISRTAYNGTEPPSVALLRAGTVKIVGQQAQLGRVYYEHRVLVKNGPGSQRVIRIPVRRTPVRIEISIKHTITAPPDPRNLGAQVAFTFVPKG